MEDHAFNQDASILKPGDTPRDFPYQNHRRLIGYLGFLLPPTIYFLAGIRQTDSLPSWVLLESISAYYYTGAVAMFVGVLFALSLFLFTYPGYEKAKADSVLGKIGGFAALGVAFFPTTAPIESLKLPWWSEVSRTIHYTSAICLFSSFIIFSLWLFRKSNIPTPEDRPADKRRRNMIYMWCGIVMIVCMVWALSSLVTHASIFWPEAIALWAFAFSWLVKGEAEAPIVNTVQALWEKGTGG